MPRHHAWLHEESRRWVDEGIIAPQQAEQLRLRYPVAEGGWGRLVLTGFGAILIGLGVALVVAYNWAEMSRFSKLGVIFAALLAAHGAGMWLRRLPDGAVAAEGMQALGTMLFGVGIWLVAQVYHIDEHYPNAFLIWGLGALALAWALPSLTQALMAVALVVVWQLFEVFDFRNPLHIAPWLLLAGVFPLVWRLRSPVLAGIATVALLCSVSLSVAESESRLTLPILLLLASAAIAIGSLVERDGRWRVEEASHGFAGPGMVAYLAVLYLFSFPDLADEMLRLPRDNSVGWFYLIGAGVVAALAWGAQRLLAVGIGGASPPSLTELLIPAGSLLTLLVLFGGTGRGGWQVAIPFNLLFLAHALWLIVTGERELRARRVVAGGLLLSLLAAARYLDLFDSLLSRSFVFFLIGGALFAAGSRFARLKRAARAGG